MKTTNTIYGKYLHEPNTSTLIWEWQATTYDAQWKDMRPAFEDYLHLSQKYPSRNHIIDERQLMFNYIPDVQLWIDKNIAGPVTKTGTQNYAIIKSEDLFIEVATSQIFEENNARIFNVRFFDNIAEAQEWLSKLKNNQ